MKYDINRNPNRIIFLLNPVFRLSQDLLVNYLKTVSTIIIVRFYNYLKTISTIIIMRFHMFSVSKNYTIYVLKVGVSCNVYCILIELLSSSRILELEHGYISPWFE